MVLPLLAAGAGYGLQWFGNEQKYSAQAAAETGYNTQRHVIDQQQALADQRLQQLMEQYGQQYRQSQAQLVGAFNPSNRQAAFQDAQGHSLTGVQQVLALLHAQNNPLGGAPQGTPYAGALQREGARANQFAQSQAQVSAQNAGLAGMNRGDQRAQFDFSNAAQLLQGRMNQARALYGVGNALRQQSLAKAGGQHDVDLALAGMRGNGAMLAGGMLQSGAQAYGAYNAAPHGNTDAGSGDWMANQGQAGNYTQTFSGGEGGSDLSPSQNQT